MGARALGSFVLALPVSARAGHGISAPVRLPRRPARAALSPAARADSFGHASGERIPRGRNLELGAFYLNELLGSFDRRVVLALASYNAGPHATFRWLAGDPPLPLDVWAARIPFSETRHYVQRVMANWARYRYLDGGPAQIPRLALRLPQDLEQPPDIY